MSLEAIYFPADKKNRPKTLYVHKNCKKKATEVGLEPTALALGGLRATIAPSSPLITEVL
jgi:hypothetical protein